jgi:FAD/FMN-containing dehydrogenase
MSTLAHEEKVARVAEAVKARVRAGGGHTSIGKSAVSHFVPNPHDPRHEDRKIDVRDLDRILSIDVERRRAIVEPGVTFVDLVAVTLRHGLLPTLVPELKTITIGGAIAGCSVESMSFVRGGLHDGCVRYELVTGTGEIVECSREQEPLLFEMMHGSYGTLGILTKVELELVPAKPFVRTEYQRFATPEGFYEAMEARIRARDVDFIDGIAHAPDCWVLCLGRFAETAPATSDYTWLDVFYRSTRERSADWLKTEDYLFRYDTECHWLTRSLPGMESRAVRFAVGKALLGSTNLLTWAKRLRPIMKHVRDPNVVVDVFIPKPRFLEFCRWYPEAIGVWPLWLVPYRVEKPYAWVADGHARAMNTDMFIDCAIYGRPPRVGADEGYRRLQDKTRELFGIKTLISKNSYDEATFWSIYHRENWESVKRRTDPHNLFRGLYEKFHFGR